MKVLLIVGDPSGGIRKHIHDILLGVFEEDIVFHYIHGDTPDKTAIEDFKILDASRINRVALVIPKGIHFMDLLNLLKVVRYCKFNGINLIHGHGSKGGVYAR